MEANFLAPCFTRASAILAPRRLGRYKALAPQGRLTPLTTLSWRQKSRMLCIKEGDNNTKFFHKVANSWRRYNHISMLEVNGVTYEDESEMADQAVQFYKNLYKETEEWKNVFG